MPRDAPVTRAMREARGRVVKQFTPWSSPRKRGPIRRAGYDAGRRSCLTLFKRRKPVVMGPRFRADDQLARFRQQRQLPWLRFDLGLVGEVRGIGAGKTMIREFRIGGIA